MQTYFTTFLACSEVVAGGSVGRGGVSLFCFLTLHPMTTVLFKLALIGRGFSEIKACHPA